VPDVSGDLAGTPDVIGQVRVPPAVQAHAAAVAGGTAWLAGLPRLLAALEQQWAVTITEWLPGGTTSVVGRATTRDGRPVVVKVAVPGSWFDDQVRTLTAADGDGYVRLLAHDGGRHAALLEALGRSLHDSGLPPGAQLSVLGRLVRRGWRTPPDRDQARDKAAELAELVPRLWEQLGQPCSEQVVAQALVCARRRSAAFDPQDAVVLHGDAAAANSARVLAPRDGTEDGFVLLDPDQFVGDRTYDLGVAVRDWSPELLDAAAPDRLLDGWCRTLADVTSTDPRAVSDWGYLERVSTGLYAMSLTAQDEGRAHLRSAQRLVDAWRSAPS
jgi:streptomycin 6-kinase